MQNDIEHTLQSVLSGRLNARAIATLQPFEKYTNPKVDQVAMAIAVAPHVEALAHFASNDNPKLRHFAVWCLGFSGTAAAVEPIVIAEAGPLEGDFFDHDYVYSACARLGDIALETLYELAKEGDELRRSVAVQALGLSRADAWPYLHRLLAAVTCHAASSPPTKTCATHADSTMSGSG